MKRALILSEFAQTPWALHPAALAKMTGVLLNWAHGIQPSADIMATIRADKEARDAKRQLNVRAGAGAIAVLPLYGVITQRGNMMDDVSGPGSCSVQQFTRQLREALADESISQVLIDFDTPGGSVYGVDELAFEIYRSRSIKPIVGISNSLCASAGYYIGSNCSEFYCTPSGEVGSIGVYTAHQDISKALESEGVGIELISAGKYKTEGHPYGPLTDEARAAIQKSVDGYYAMFTKAVSRGRNVPIARVRDGMGEGRCLSASDALAAGMIDGVATFDEVIEKMQSAARSSRGASGLAKARHELEILGYARPGLPIR